MDLQGHVLVVGGAGIDYKGRPEEKFHLDTMNPGKLTFGFSGVARNIAESLARLEVEVVLLTALGNDSAGDEVLKHCQQSGIRMDYVLRPPEERTGGYITVLGSDGEMIVAISDFHIMEHIDETYLDHHDDVFAGARMLVIDLNLPPTSLAHVIKLGKKHNIPIVADPTSPARAAALRPYLKDLYMIMPNAAETTSLCGLEIPAFDLESAVDAAKRLVTLGTNIAIVTLGENGLAYAEGSGTGHIPARHTHIVDSTGAGDALSAGTIFGLINDIPLDEAMRLGVTAASLTLQSTGSVSAALTPDAIYDSLII